MNVLALTLLNLRLTFLGRCWVSLLTVGGFVLLAIVEWRIALGALLLETARNGYDRLGGRA